MIIYGGDTSLQLQLTEELEVVKGKIEIQEKNQNICNVYMEKISDYINHVSHGSFNNQSELETTLISLKSICNNVILDLQSLGKLREFLLHVDMIPEENLKEFIDSYNSSYPRNNANY